jgi:uncharacterized protein (DUF58 family)
MKQPTRVTHQAEALAGVLPPLLVEAERIAAAIAPGVHGRRRIGPGDSFWQFRPYVQGDQTQRIDWRQTARTDRVYVRDTEWEAAQTVYLWRDPSPRMAWSADPALPRKRDRAELILLALGSLLLRAGERVAWHGAGGRPASGTAMLAQLAAAMTAAPGLPPWPERLPRYAGLVIATDGLDPAEEIAARIRALAGLSLRGHVLHVLDPSEIDFPFTGRLRFRPVTQGSAAVTIPRAEAVREAYAARIAAQIQAVAQEATRAGWGVTLHRTDHRPETALLALHAALSPARRGA